MKLNEDYSDVLREFSDADVEYLLVGAYAMAVHGHVRATMDIDLWVNPDRGNAEAVYKALARFGAPMDQLSIEDLESTDTVFQIGVEPWRINVLTSATGLGIQDSLAHSVGVDIEGIAVRVLSLDDLITTTRATGRKQDEADVEALELLRDSQSSADTT